MSCHNEHELKMKCADGNIMLLRSFAVGGAGPLNKTNDLMRNGHCVEMLKEQLTTVRTLVIVQTSNVIYVESLSEDLCFARASAS